MGEWNSLIKPYIPCYPKPKEMVKKKTYLKILASSFLILREFGDLMYERVGDIFGVEG